jgi:hypothetical protein
MEIIIYKNIENGHTAHNEAVELVLPQKAIYLPLRKI